MAANCDLDIKNNIATPISSVFSTDKLSTYTGYMTGLVGNIFTNYIYDKNYTVGQLTNPKIVNEIYTRANTLISNLIAAHDIGWDKLSAKDLSELPIGFTSESDTLSDSVLDDLDKILNNYPAFVQWHKVSSNLFVNNSESINEILNDQGDKDVFDLSTDEDVTETSQLSDEENSEKIEQYDKSANEEDPYDSLGNDIKVLFSLPLQSQYNIATAKIEILKDSNGLPMPAVASRIYTKTISKINDIKDENTLLQRLQDEQLHKIVPEIPQILKILNVDNWVDRSDDQKKLWVKFHNNFSKPAIGVQSLVFLGGGEAKFSTLQEDIKGNTQKIRNLWVNNFNLSKNNKVKKDVTGKTFFTKDAIPEASPSNINEALAFLDILGINLSTQFFEDEKRNDINTSIITQAKRLYQTVSDVVKAFPSYTFKNPIAELTDGNYTFVNSEGRDSKKKMRSEAPTIASLVGIESNYTTLVPSMSARNSLGELQYLISNESNISLTTSAIKNSKSINELLLSTSFVNLKYNPLYKSSAILNLLFDKNGRRREDFSVSLNFISGVKEGIKAAVTRNFSDRQKIITDFNTMLANGKTDVMRPETSNSFYSLSVTQKDVLQNSREINRLFIPTDDFIAGIVPAKVASQFLSYLNAEIERIQSYPDKVKSLPSLTSEYGEFSIFNYLSNALKTELKKGKIDENSTLYKQFIGELTSELDKESIAFQKDLDDNNISDRQLIATNLISSENPLSPDEVKKLKNSFLINNLIQNIEFSILYSGDSLFYKEMHKRLKGLSSTGVYTNISDTATSIVKNSDYYKNYKMSSLLEKYEGVSIPEKADDVIYSKVIKDKTAKDYSDFFYKDSAAETSDGQGWGNPDFFHELSLRQGWSNEFTDRVFKYESLIMKRDILEQPLSKAETALLTSIEAKIYENPDMHSISVMKAGYFGPILNTEVDGKVYDKFSVAPLLPSFVKTHPELKDTLLNMLKGNYDYIKYGTGTKGFKTEVINKQDLETAKPDVLSKNLFKLQIAYSNTAKTDTSIPTQLLKLIYSNQFNNGEAKSNEIKTLYDGYLSTLNKIQKENITSLFNSLGLSRADGGGINVDYKILSEKLLREAIKRGMNSNIQNSLKYNPETKYFSTTPELTSSSEIEKLLSSIMDKTLRRFKVNGGDFVLITNAESPRLNFYRNEAGTITKSECRITLTKEFAKLLKLTHSDGAKIATLDRLNALLKTSWAEQNEKSITVIFDRVPTQELNSMDVSVVKEFLSPTIGNVVQLADEIVVKAGLDFDFDKEKTMIPSFDAYGRYIDYDENETSESLNSKINELKTEGSNYTKSDADVKDIMAQVRKINFQQFSQSKEVKDNINKYYNEIGIEIENVRNLVAEMNSLVKQINNDRQPENYIQYKEVSSEKLLSDIFNIDENTLYQDALQEGRSELDERLINLYTLYKAKEDAYIQMQQINTKFDSIRDKLIDNTKYKEFKEFSNNLRAIISQQENFFENLSNKVVSNYSNALLHTDRFEDLTRPNSSEGIKKIALENGERMGISTAMPKKDRVFYYTENRNVFSTFFNSKNMLAPYAKMNTLQQLLAYSGVKLNPIIRKVWSPTFTTYTQLSHNLLLSPEEISKITDEKGKLLIGNNTDAAGIQKQLWNSQSINATVDAAKDPYFRNLLLNYRNIGVETLMSLMGYPKERTVAFLSHSGIRSYIKNLENGMMKDEAKEQLIKRLGLKIPELHQNVEMTQEKFLEMYKNPLFSLVKQEYKDKAKSKDRIVSYTYLVDILVKGKTGLTALLTKLNTGEDISNTNIMTVIDGTPVSIADVINDKFIDEDGWKALSKPENDLQKAKDGLESADKIKRLTSAEIRAFAFFFNMENANFAFRNLAQYLSFDTAKVDGMMGVEKRNKLREEILSSEIVSEGDLNKLERQSTISSFDNTSLISAVFNKFMPLSASNKDELYSIIDAYNSNFTAKSKKGSRMLPNAIQNDFIYSILFNFGTRAKNGFNLITSVTKKDETGAITYKDLIDRLEYFKNSSHYKSFVKSFPIFNDLVGSIHFRERSEFYKNIGSVLNIQLIKNNKMTPIEEENIITQFRNMINTETFNEKPAINTSIKNLINDIFDASLAQSGLNKSTISFKEFIPNEYFQKDSEDALKAFYALSPEEKSEYIAIFKQRFQYNNKTYFPEIINDTNRKLNFKNPNNSQNNIKFYDIQVKKLESIKNISKNEKNNNENTNFLEMFLNSGNYEFLDIPNKFNDKQINEIYENNDLAKKYTKRININNYERAISMQNKHGDTSYFKDRVIDISEIFEAWKEEQISNGSIIAEEYNNINNQIGEIIKIKSQSYRILDVKEGFYANTKDIIISSKSGINKVATISRNGDIEIISDIMKEFFDFNKDLDVNDFKCD